MRRLFVFTEVFPFYGRETFLEVEVLYLSKRFDKVLFIPFRSTCDGLRDIPENCNVAPSVTHNRMGMYFGLLHPSRAHVMFFEEFFKKKVFLNKKRMKTWLVAFAMTNSYLHNTTIKQLYKDALDTDVFYSYWGKGGCFLAPFFKKKGAFVSRFHGEWDLWEESSGNYGPIRQKIISNLRVVFPISNKGKDYLIKRYNTNEVVVSRLGTQYHGKASRSVDGCFRIVSCSTVNANKRVLFMLEAFSSCTFPIEWTHIGTGPEFDCLKKRVASITNRNLKVNLMGRLSNSEVFDFYLTHPVDCFINISKNEGIPVSIMEAISCGIPVIATDVGSTCEVMSHEAGVLLPPNPTEDEISQAILKIKQGSFSPFSFWDLEYNAEKNYNRFIDILISL